MRYHSTLTVSAREYELIEAAVDYVNAETRRGDLIVLIGGYIADLDPLSRIEEQ